MLEHFDGYMPARIPRIQIRLKIVTSKGFRQETKSCADGEKLTSAAKRISPMKEDVRKKADTRLRVFLKSSP